METSPLLCTANWHWFLYERSLIREKVNIVIIAHFEKIR